MPWAKDDSEGVVEEYALRREAFLKNMWEDILNEYTHMHVYLHAAIVVQGLHREELSEFFMKEAASEMEHVAEFGKMFLGIFDMTPPGAPRSDTHLDYAPLYGSTDPQDILSEIVRMENHVVRRYAKRMEEAEELGGPDGSVLHVFYENQILDSRLTVNHVKQMLKGL